MNIQKTLKKLPYLVAIKRRLHRALGKRIYNNTRVKLRAHGGQGSRIATALDLFEQPLRYADNQWVEKIENERKEMLRRHEQLVDGSLGDAGIYDKNVTVKMACSVSKPPRPSLMLYQIVKAVKPTSVLELGTNVGISGAFIASALLENGNDSVLVTCDASPYRQRLAQNMHSRLGLSNVKYVNGLFTDTLAPTLQEMGHVDLAFIDGHHQFQPTLDYYNQILGYSEPSAVFVFDDIRWSEGMLQAWSKLKTDTRLGVIVDLASVGVAVRGMGEEGRFVSPRVNVF